MLLGKEGLLTTLECYSNGSTWPEPMGAFTLYYHPSGVRDIEGLRRSPEWPTMEGG